MNGKRIRNRTTTAKSGQGIVVVVRYLAAATVVLCCHTPTLHAQDHDPVRVTDAGIVLDFQDADLRVVISALAELAGLSIVYTGLPAQNVTLRTAGPVPREHLRGLINAVATANNLSIVDESGILRITAQPRQPQPRPTTAEEPDPERVPENIELFVHHLNHARAVNMARTLADLFGLSTSAAREPGGGARPPLSAQLRDQRLQPGGPPAEARVTAGDETAKSGGMAASLTGPVQVVPDPPTNTLLVRAGKTDYETLRAAIDALDARPLQALIEVLIVEVRRETHRGLGIDITIPSFTDRRTRTTLGGELEGRSLGDLAIHALGIGAIGADVLINALAASGEVSIVSRPVVVAQNNQSARILVGSQRPFIQLYRSLPTDDAVRDQVVQYRDVGTQLTIRPTINPDGHVTLSVLQEVSNATAETQFGAPIISTREAETELLIKDGHTAVMGGLLDREYDTGSTGVPLLRSIPLLGALFRSGQTRQGTTELFLFLTPHVLRSDEDLDDATKRLRDGTEHLRRRFDKPLPLIQLYDTIPPPKP